MHGLLRERLLSGKEALGGALTAARRAYEAVASEDASPQPYPQPQPHPHSYPYPNPYPPAPTLSRWPQRTRCRRRALP